MGYDVDDIEDLFEFLEYLLLALGDLRLHSRQLGLHRLIYLPEIGCEIFPCLIQLERHLAVDQVELFLNTRQILFDHTLNLLLVGVPLLLGLVFHFFTLLADILHSVRQTAKPQLLIFLQCIESRLVLALDVLQVFHHLPIYYLL